MTNIVVFGSKRQQPPIYSKLVAQAVDKKKKSPYRPEILEIVTRCWRFTLLAPPPK